MKDSLWMTQIIMGDKGTDIWKYILKATSISTRKFKLLPYNSQHDTSFRWVAINWWNEIENYFENRFLHSKENEN